MKITLKILTIVILIIIDLKIQTVEYKMKITIRVDKIKNLGSMYNDGICVKPKKENSSICEAVYLCFGCTLTNNYQINAPLKWFVRTPIATDESRFYKPENYFEELIPDDKISVYLNLMECNKEVVPNLIRPFLSFWSSFSVNLDCTPCMSDNNFAELWGNIRIKNLYKALKFRSISFIVENLSMGNYLNLFSKSYQDQKYNKDSTYLQFLVNGIREYQTVNSYTFLHSPINTVFFFSNQFDFWFSKNGIKIKIILSKYGNTNVVFGSDEISAASISSPFHSLVVTKNVSFQTDPIKLIIQTFSTNYVGDNLENFCNFTDKDSVCGKDGNHFCVRKYKKNLDENCKVIDPCLTNICQNSAKCKRTLISYVCVCALGSSGKYCEKLYCNRNCDVCLINKICRLCKNGWEGKDCSKKSCTPYDCGFGKCQLINNTRSCLCPKGIFGEKCNDTCSTDCINGVCDFYNGYSNCKCHQGYMGINCNIRDFTYPFNYSKSDKFIYTLTSITIIITFIIIIIFILLLRFNPNRELDDQDVSIYFVTQAGINQTEMTKKEELSSVKTNVNELPDIMYEFNIAEKLKERVKKQELSEHNSEKDSSKEEKISTITDASLNIIYDKRYE